MERGEYYPPTEQQPSPSFSEGMSLEKHGVIAQLTDRLYLTMATKINGGEAPLTSVSANWIDPDRGLYAVQIRGDEQFTNGTQQALDLLQDRASDFYNFVRQNIGIIQQVERGSGMESRAPIPVFLSANKSSIFPNPTKRYASDMVHEAWHSYRYYTWLKAHPEATNTLYAAWLSETIEEQEKECGTIQYGALVRLKASPLDLIDVKTAIKLRHWEVPYEKRYW